MLKLNSTKSYDFANVEDITPEECLKHKDQVYIIDVRRPDEFNGELGHIPGAIHIVLDTLPGRLDEIPTDKPAVFVCLAGGRSGRAAAFAFESGLKNVYNMQGGMSLWNEKNLPTEIDN